MGWGLQQQQQVQSVCCAVCCCRARRAPAGIVLVAPPSPMSHLPCHSQDALKALRARSSARDDNDGACGALQQQHSRRALVRMRPRPAALHSPLRSTLVSGNAVIRYCRRFLSCTEDNAEGMWRLRAAQHWELAAAGFVAHSAAATHTDTRAGRAPVRLLTRGTIQLRPAHTRSSARTLQGCICCGATHGGCAPAETGS